MVIPIADLQYFNGLCRPEVLLSGTGKIRYLSRSLIYYNGIGQWI